MNDKENEDLVEEELFEEEGEIQNLPDSPILDIPIPDTVEEYVKLNTDGRNFNELSSYEKIKFAASQNGVAVKKPNSTCNNCNGTGVVSHRNITTDVPTVNSDGTSAMETVSEQIPNPCRCIFDKKDLPKMFTGKVPVTRKLERANEKRNRKLLLMCSKDIILEKERLLEKRKAKKKAKKKMRKKFNKR